MSEPKKQFITRKDAALFFANSTTAITATFCLASNLCMLIVWVVNGTEFEQITYAAMGAAKVLFLALPIVWLLSLITGENAWRSTYSPGGNWDAAITRGILVPLLGAALYFNAPIVFLIPFYLFFEFLIYRSKRTLVDRRPPERTSIALFVVAAVGAQVALIALHPAKYHDEQILIIQQAIGTGCVLILESLITPNILYDWRERNLLPPGGNHRFQIQLNTMLWIMCGLGLWGALLKWTFF